MTYSKHYSAKKTSQSEAIPGEAQVENSAGGYSYALDDWKRLDRFLILGAEGGTYYATEKDLTVENCTVAAKLLKQDGKRVVERVVEVSEGGRAPKNEPALFVLAMATAAEDLLVRKMAWALLPRVARIGTHLFQFVEYRKALGGFGRSARRGIGAWYTEKSAQVLAHQVLKYPQREGWSHRDVLRLCHAVPKMEGQAEVFSAITHPDGGHVKNSRSKRAKVEWWMASPVAELVASKRLPYLYEGVLKAQKAETGHDCADIVREYKLTREMVPTHFLTTPVVYEALLEHMPLGAMVRNLGNMSKIGLLTPLSEAAKFVVGKLSDKDGIKKARLHPLNLLVASRTYAQGHGMLGKGEWTVVPQVSDALDGALALSFDYAEPTGKRWVIGVDVSSSMSSPMRLGVSACEAAACMALVVAKTEPQYFIGGFCNEFVDLGITAKDTFAQAAKKAQRRNFGSTDCAVPMLYADKNKIEAEAFMVVTDGETWAGSIHPSQALRLYRGKFGIDSKLVVVGMTSTGFTIADPKDPGMLDVVGMDTTVPQVVADFVRG